MSKKYIINEDLRNGLIGLILLLELKSERIYHDFSGKYSYRIMTDTGEEIKLPFLSDLKRDLKDLPETETFIKIKLLKESLGLYLT